MGSNQNCSTVLVVDDDIRILKLLVQLLNREGFKAVGAENATEAREKLNGVDIIVVDCMMPDESGIDFIKSIREEGNEVPAIMLTALDGIDNKVLSFENGVDDYLTKPFDERELIARLQRIAFKQQKDDVISFGNCSFNKSTGVLLQNGERIHLSTTEQALLAELLVNSNQPTSRSVIATKLGMTVSDRTVDVQITRLRKKIGDNSKTPEIIQTVRHVGYKIKAI